jgi:PAS domain S-box-containing protein
MPQKQLSSDDKYLKRSILIACDDFAAVAEWQALLERNGYAALITTNSADALHLVREAPLPLALLELKAGFAATIELAQRLKQARPALVCLVVTEEITFIEAIEALTNGVSHFARKPLVEHEEELLATLESSFKMLQRDVQLEEELDRLQEREYLYRRAIDRADAVTYQRDFKTDSFSFVDQGIYKLTGYRPEELTQEVWRSMIQECIMRGAAAGLSEEEAQRDTRQGELKEWHADWRIIARDGKEHWLADSSVRLHDENGMPVASLGILQDVTERKRLEGELRKLNVELELRVAERTEELQQANEIVQEKNDILGRTVYELRERERIMAEELELAQEVQMHFLPKVFPFCDELTFAAQYRSCSKIGGDLYDAFKLGNRTVGFYIADASGHGISAALVTAVLKVSFERFRQHQPPNGHDPASVVNPLEDKWRLSTFMGALNKALSETIPDTAFVTFQFGILHLDTGRLLLANAGHVPPIVYDNGNGEIREVAVPSNLPLGMLPSWKYEIAETMLPPGHKLIVYTDGLTEQMNGQLEEFGKDNLLAAIKQHGHLAPEELLGQITETASEFTGESEAIDDQSMLVIDYVRA